MNERDLQILAAVGETLKEALAGRDQTMADQLKAASDRVEQALLSIDQAVAKAATETAANLAQGINAQVKAAVEAIELPDFNAMLEKAVSQIELPTLPALPDFNALVKEAVAGAVAAIDLPKPEPLPDIKAMVAEQVAADVSAIELPIPESVDLEALAAKAAGLVQVPQPEALPDIGAMVASAVSEAIATIELPQPAEVNLDEVAQKAADLVIVPVLPDVAAMVKTAVDGIEMPQPEKVDLEQVASQVKLPQVDTAAIAKAAAELIEVPVAPEVDIPAIAAAASALVEIPQPREVDLDALAESAATKAAGKIKIPADMLAKAAAEAVAAIELPKAPDFAAMLKAAVAEIELPEPVPGDHGRDALQLEVLPEIDSTKSYPRGTYASHDGGLWRTYEKSHGMRGWECVMNGIARTEIKASDDLRTVTFVNTHSDGTVTEKHFDLPVVIDRGVFKHGNTYKTGDAVTWGGSLWIAQEPTADKPGEPAAKGWRLAVKKGRDAK